MTRPARGGLGAARVVAVALSREGKFSSKRGSSVPGCVSIRARSNDTDRQFSLSTENNIVFSDEENKTLSDVVFTK